MTDRTRLLLVHDEQGRDFIFIEERQRVIDQVVGMHGLWITGHKVDGRMIEPALDVPPKVPVRDDADQISVLVRHPDDAKALCGHFHDGVMHRTIGAGQRNRITPVHEAMDRP